VTRRPGPLPDALGDSFSVREARAAGVSEGRLRSADLETPFSGVRCRRMPEDEHSESDESPAAHEARMRRTRILARARAYARIMSPDAFFSHVTAALVWGMPLPLRALRVAGPTKADALADSVPQADRPIDVAVPLPLRGPRVPNIRTHRLAAALVHTRAHDDMRVASPATTWAQLGEVLTVDELIVAGDALVREPRLAGGVRGRPGSGLATIAQLQAAVAAGRRTGVAKLREALPQIRVGSASPPETELRLALRRAGLPAPALDIDVLAENGTLIGCTELAYPRWRLLIEFEGDHHRTSRTQWDRDIEKHAQCVSLGWTVLRFTARHVYPTPSVAVTAIREALLRAGWRPGDTDGAR
jgi:hypothetical protein